MIQYVFIPKSYEAVLTSAILKWTENPNAWTVITGVYASSSVLNNSESTVFNKIKTGEIIKIKNGYELDGLIYELIGFCLEGDIEFYTPDFYAVLKSHEDILFFNSAAEFINTSFINVTII